MEVIQGKSIFGGIAIGPIYFFTKEQKQVKRTKIEDAAAEIKRYEDACETAKEQLGELYEKALKEVGESAKEHCKYERHYFKRKIFGKCVLQACFERGACVSAFLHF